MAARTFPSTSVPRHQPKLRQPSLSSTRTPPMATRSQRHRGLPCTTSPLRPDVVANCWIRSLPCLASRAPRSILPSSPASPVRNPEFRTASKCEDSLDYVGPCASGIRSSSKRGHKQDDDFPICHYYH